MDGWVGKLYEAHGQLFGTPPGTHWAYAASLLAVQPAGVTSTTTSLSG
jgi:hypothetical protein